MSKTAKSFVDKYNGQAIDYDKAYGVQCVDGARVWQDYFLGASIPCAGNYASGYWTGNRSWFKAKGCTEVTNYKNLKNGDLVIWPYGSKSHPSSHVAMYYNGQEFGQNQGGNRQFRLKSTDFSDMAGAFRSSNCDPGTTAPSASTKDGTIKTGFNKAYAKGKTMVAKVNLNLRTKASTSTGSVIKVEKAGTKLYYYGYYAYNGNIVWYKVSDGTNEGYVYGGVLNSGVAPYLKNANP
jgi:hypothetical protein